MGWFAFGIIYNLRRGDAVLKWMQDGLPQIGERTTFRWLGTSVAELVIAQAKKPFPPIGQRCSFLTRAMSPGCGCWLLAAAGATRSSSALNSARRPRVDLELARSTDLDRARYRRAAGRQPQLGKRDLPGTALPGAARHCSTWPPGRSNSSALPSPEAFTRAMRAFACAGMHPISKSTCRSPIISCGCAVELLRVVTRSGACRRQHALTPATNERWRRAAAEWSAARRLCATRPTESALRQVSALPPLDRACCSAGRLDSHPSRSTMRRRTAGRR